MKKSLIALAVLGAFAGVAAAKSSATLYGMLDVGYGISNAGGYEGKGTTGKATGASTTHGKFQQWGNANSTSRWGLKGSEQISSGLTAVFNLESAIQPEKGDSTGFARAAWVGLSGNFGTVIAGRMTTVMNNVLGEFDLSGTPNLTSSLGNVGISAVSQSLGGKNYSRINSAIAYVSPDLSGFSFQAAVALKNDDILGLDNAASTDGQRFIVDPVTGAPIANTTFDPKFVYVEAKNLYTVGAKYKIGGFTVAAAFESKPYSIKDLSSSYGIGVKYNFNDSFTLSAGYLDNHLKADGRGFYVGALVPVQNFEFGAQVAYNTKITAGTETKYAWLPNAAGNGFDLYDVQKDRKIKPLAWELFAKYKLSKRTQVYAQYGGINNDAEEFQGADRKYSAAVGLLHKF